jgi:hypothetical protein
MEYQKEVAGVLARAVHDHLLTFPAFPLEELSLTYSEFASSGGERNRYKQAFMSLKKQQELTQRALPVRVGNPELGELFSQSGSSEGDGEDTRQKVLRTAVQNLQGTVQGMLNQWLYVADVFHPPVLADWLQTIPMVEPKWFDLFGPGFTDSLVRYLNEIYGWSVRSNHAVGLELSRYDAMRFFVMALDRAIGFLPWSKATVFVMDGLRTATSNLMYGQSQNVQHLLFKGRSSPVIDTDPFFVLELAKSHPHFGDVKQNLSDYSRHTRFLASCSELLVDKKQTGRISE